VVLHASGTPNPTVGSADGCRCLSLAQAAMLGLSIDGLREEYTVAVDAFPDERAALAAAWSELQFILRDRLETDGREEFDGSSMFSVVFFEADGRIARFLHRGLEPEQESVLCEVVEKLADKYRFPLQSEVRFSQCGTTHFGEE
jgi:hypothetical protein